jgi:UDP-GlcNAc:undecaprenyl-phosphate/decaprenyl-phosphate GlcNAc-1-phosphate transferase
MIETNPKELIAVLLAFAGSVFIAWFSMPLVVKVATLRNLTDPPGHRKIHKKEIPTLGGVGIFAGFSFGFLMAINSFMDGVTYFTVAALLLFFVGLKDDLVTLDPRKRLIAEVFAALILIFYTDIRLTCFHGFLGVTDIPIWATYLTTIFILIVIINAVNLIDGIDGLAASTGIVASISLGIWFWLSGAYGYSVMAASLAGTLLAFLRFNLSKGKNRIFMGDTGSLLVGFILAVMAIRFNEINIGSDSYHHMSSSPAISIAILIVPMYDTLRVFTIRIIKGLSPFSADNRHIHHLMLRAGFSHRMTTLLISLAHIGIIALAFFLDHIGILWLALVLLIICLILTGLIYLMVYLNYQRKNIAIDKIDAGMIRVITYLHGTMNQKGNQLSVSVLTNNPGANLPGKVHHKSKSSSRSSVLNVTSASSKPQNTKTMTNEE